MPKSKDGSGDGSDGRKNNSPPEHGKIKPGEIRNKWGRRGKPEPVAPTSMDELICEEAARIVSHDANGPVDAKRRLVQDEFFAALHGRDSTVRARLLAQLHVTTAKVEHEQQEILKGFIEAKSHFAEKFYFAQQWGRPPPDILPHYEHIHIRNGIVEFRGPIDRAGRKAWELIKSAISVTACLHDILRREYRRTGSHVVLEELRALEKHRRWLMRAVPKGWNWREEIYCVDSRLAFTKQTVKDLKEMGYVPPDDCD